jgi:WD40 repeat protein
VRNWRFLHIQFSKSSELLFVLSGTEVVLFASVGAGLASYEYLKTVLYIEGNPDTPLCLSVHPSGSVVAICSAARRSVLLVATGTGSATTADFKTNLRKKPKLDDDETKSPIENDDMDSFHPFPSIANEIKMATGRHWPVTAKWSRYGETLVIGSSDNLLSIWNILSAQLETVSLGAPEVVIRNVLFVNDVFVVVSINHPGRILLVNIDEGILYDSQEESQLEIRNIQPGSASRCASLDHYVEKNNFVITRPVGDMTIAQWKLSL